jgi:hypothetical protein
MIFYRPLQAVALVLSLVFCSGLTEILIAAENPLQTVFVLHSYHRGYKWSDDQSAGIDAALRGSVDQNHIYVDYLDAGRMSFTEDLDNLYRFYEHKYRGVNFDVICVTDADALEFMLRYKDRLFP